MSRPSLAGVAGPERLDQAGEVDWNLAVVGGGAIGTAVARAAARAGLATLLLEQRDFGRGTHAVRREGARTIADVVQRRMMVGHRPDLGKPAADALAAPLGELLGWDSARRSLELRRYAEEIDERRLPTAGTGSAAPGEAPASAPGDADR